MKLALAMIVRNVEETIIPCLDSILPYVDRAVIGFGGKSTDATEKIVTERLQYWFESAQQGRSLLKSWTTMPIAWNDDFAAARNYAWHSIEDSDDVDWVIWLDGDDILLNGDKLRERVEQADAGGYNTLLVPYFYEQDEHGNPSCTLMRERVVKDPSKWHWIGAIHEILSLEGSGVDWKPIGVEDVVVKHHPDRVRAAGERNLDILYKELERTEPNPPRRILFYLGRENLTRDRFDDAVRYFRRYLAVSEQDQETYQVHTMLAEVFRHRQRYDDARAELMTAIQIEPKWADAYFLLARIAYDQGHFVETIEWTKTGAGKEIPQTTLIVDPRAYTYWPYWFLGLAYGQLGDWEAAIENMRKAAQTGPDAMLMHQIETLENERDAQEVLRAFTAIWAQLAKHDEWLKARELFKQVPKMLEQHPAVQGMWRDTAQMTAHIENPQLMVDFYKSNPGWYPVPDEVILNHGKHMGWEPRINFARKNLCAPPVTVLDMAAADGFISLPLAMEGYNVVGYDIDPRPIEVARQRAIKWGLRADYREGTVDDLAPDEKYDVAIAFEVIEHLVDVGAFLDKLDAHANKVVLTTPYLSWENGHYPDWNKVELKGHIRIFNLADLEMLLAPRGQIIDLYREPFNWRSSWIFASYRPGRETTTSVTLLAPGSLERWGPRKLKQEGLGGSETALIRLSEEFAAAGMGVSVYNQIDEPGYYNGVRYREWEKYDPRVKQDVTVAWRYPEIADMPLRTERLVLWMHDVDAGDRLTPVRAARFDAIVVLSQWHKRYMLGRYPFLDPDRLVVIGNGVDPERFSKARLDFLDAHPDEINPRDPKRVVYTSSPDRGLDVVLESIWPKVTEAVPDAELHVYYGWGNFEALKASRPDLAAFQQRVAELALHNKNVVFHGRVTQDQLAEELLKASIWLYPTYFSETYCISAVEAQLAGVIPITNDLAALAETVRAGVIIPLAKSADVREYADVYANEVIEMLKDEAHMAEVRKIVLDNAPRLSWEDVAKAWVGVVFYRPASPSEMILQWSREMNSNFPWEEGAPNGS